MSGISKGSSRVLEKFGAGPFSCVEVARGVGYPACRQAPYVALVVPAYGEIMWNTEK